MSQSAPLHWLVTYDIADPRRLGRVFRFLKKEGVPVQYSVFWVNCNAIKMAALIAQVRLLITANEDDVRAYRIPERSATVTIGRAIITDDCWVVQQPFLLQPVVGLKTHEQD